MATTVQYRNNNGMLPRNSVIDTEWEPAESDPRRFPVDDRECLWMLPHARENGLNFIQEFFAKPWSLRLVPARGLLQVAPGT